MMTPEQCKALYRPGTLVMVKQLKEKGHVLAAPPAYPLYQNLIIHDIRNLIFLKNENIILILDTAIKEEITYIWTPVSLQQEGFYDRAHSSPAKIIYENRLFVKRTIHTSMYENQTIEARWGIRFLFNEKIYMIPNINRSWNRNYLKINEILRPIQK